MSNLPNYLTAKVLLNMFKSDVEKRKWNVTPNPKDVNISEESKDNLVLYFKNTLTNVLETKNIEQISELSVSVQSTPSDSKYDADNSVETSGRLYNSTLLDNDDLNKTEKYFADNSNSVYDFSYISDVLSSIPDNKRNEIVDSRKDSIAKKNNETSSGIHSDDCNDHTDDRSSDASSIDYIIPMIGDDSDSEYTDNNNCARCGHRYNDYRPNTDFYRLYYGESDCSEKARACDSDDYSLDMTRSAMTDSMSERSSKRLSWVSKSGSKASQCSCRVCVAGHKHRPDYSLTSKSSWHTKFQSTPLRQQRNGRATHTSSMGTCENCIKARTRLLAEKLSTKYPL